MKKLFKLFTVLGVALCLGACSSNSKLSEKDANDAFVASHDVLKNADSFTIDANASFEMTSSGMTLSGGGEVSSAIRGIKDNDAELSASIKFEALGQKMESTMYYIDGYQYSDEMGKKIKTESDMNNMLGNMTDLTKEFTLEKFENYTAEEIENTIVFTINMSVEDIMKLSDSLPGQSVPEGFKFDKFEMIYTIDSETKAPISIKMDIAAMQKEGEVESKMVMVLNLVYSKINETQITAPTDLDSYVEYGFGDDDSSGLDD